MVPQSRRAWIVNPNHEKAPDGSPLCEIHVGRTTVPVGWVITDNRSTSKKRKKKAKRVSKKDATPTQIIKDAYPEPDLSIEIPVEDALILEEDSDLGVETQERENLEELISEPFEETFLQVVPDGGMSEQVTQGSLWEDGVTEEQVQPGQEAPLLQRAFRLVNDD
tara:strand:- start:1114 stop:1608 length:495 start_codon:yes stop_codon:yes gene_type:complete